MTLFKNMCYKKQNAHFIFKFRTQGDIVLSKFQSSSLERLILKMKNNADNLNSAIERKADLK